MSLHVMKVSMIILAIVYLIAAVGYWTNGEHFKAGAMLACGVLFVFNFARYTDVEG